MITKDPEARLGQVENTVRREIEAVAEQVGLSFIVNTILNHEQKIVAVVAGEMRQAFRAGVEIAKLACGAEFRTAADIVIASSYPIDINLWQAGKALYSADLVTKDGGLIILVSPCSEGVGENGSFRDLIFQDYESIEKLIASGSVDKISAAAALAVALVRQRVEVWMVTQGVTEADCKKMGFKRFLSVSEAVEAAMEERPGATFSIMHNACEVLPIIKERENV
jgi:nickel-dependent lactate racemase